MPGDDGGIQIPGRDHKVELAALKYSHLENPHGLKNTVSYSLQLCKQTDWLCTNFYIHRKIII